MSNSGNILSSWQEYDITVPRAVPAGPTYGGYTGYESPLDDAIEDDEDLESSYSGNQIFNVVYDGGWPDPEGQTVHQSFEAESTYTLKITRVVMGRNGILTCPDMIASLYLADVDGKPTGDALMSATFEAQEHDGTELLFYDINWKDGSPKDYELQEGTKYVIEIKAEQIPEYPGIIANNLYWCADTDQSTFSGVCQELYWNDKHPLPGDWYVDDDWACLFRNFGE